MAATASRNRAVLDLTFDRIDFDNDLIALNPDGREQTLKYRPTVKLPSCLKPWLVSYRKAGISDHLVHFQESPGVSIRSAWRSLRSSLKLDGAAQPYSLRHTMARWLRKSGVSAWEAAAQLGHKMPDVSTTEIYAPFGPSYLAASSAAIDAFFNAVACQLRANSMADYMTERLQDYLGQDIQRDGWWFGGDLNSRPHDYESCALTS